MTHHTVEHVDLGDVRLGVHRFGTGPRRITCLHSLALDGSWWEPLADALGPEVEIIAPDLRGHGLTEAGDQSSLTAMADDVLRLWDHLGVDSSPLVGLSMGGMVAQAVAAAAPERVEALVLIATTHRFPDAALAGTRQRIEAVRAAGGLAPSADGLIDRWFGAGASALAEPLPVRAHAQLVATDPRAHVMALEAMTQVNDLERTTVPPTLLIAPKDDLSTPLAVMESLRDEYGSARLEVVPGSHLSPITHPGPVAALIRDVLDIPS